jgi:hypothetical protein
MPPPGLRSLTFADLTDDRLRALVDHGEDLFVERKRQPPQAGIGRVVASFANTLGGWVLLGVADDGSLYGYPLPAGTDAQSHVGQLLSAEVEPLPPFIAAVRELDGKPLLIIRVFESADTPHLLKMTGGVPVRTPGGTADVPDQRSLLELARRGEEAMERARERLSSDRIVIELSAPERPDLVGVGLAEPYAILRAGVLTPMPHFADWAVSSAAADAATRSALEAARILGIQLSPSEVDVAVRGRGVSAGWTAGFQVPVHCRLSIDADGVVGGRLARGVGVGTTTLHSIEMQYISPLVLTVGDMLQRAEAFGRVTWRLDVVLPRDGFSVLDAERQLRQPFFSVADGSSPPEFLEANQMISRWRRELARELGVSEWG